MLSHADKVAACLLAVLLMGCELSAAPSVDLGATPTAVAESVTPTLASPTESREQFLAEAAAGAWRPAALPISPGFLDRVEATCVAAEPDLAGLPVSVRELRGEGLVTLVLGDAADGQASFLCRGGVDTTSAGQMEIVALDAPDEPIGDEAIDLVRWESLTSEDGDTRLVAIGRVGRLVDRVVAGFPDESEVEAAKGGGWWAMWWPGSETTITIAALNRQSLAIDSLAPEGPPARTP